MTDKQTTWIDEFEILFDEVDCDCEYCLDKNRADIKQFIQEEIDKAYEEGRKSTQWTNQEADYNVSAWRDFGKKMGYWAYFEEEVKEELKNI